jgi:hypothetical protein
MPHLCDAAVSASCLWLQHARESGAYVARELLGKEQPDYDYLPYFYSRIYDLGWEVGIQQDVVIGIFMFRLSSYSPLSGA